MVALHNTPRYSREIDYMGFLGKKKDSQRGLRSILSCRLYFGLSHKISNFYFSWSDPWSVTQSVIWSMIRSVIQSVIWSVIRSVIQSANSSHFRSFYVVLGHFRSFLVLVTTHLQVQIFWLNLQICWFRSFTSKAVSVSTRSYVRKELWILFSTAVNYIIFSALRFWWHISCIGPNHLFCIRQVLNFYIKFCTCQRHKTVNEFR